jgi:hypothetical protein
VLNSLLGNPNDENKEDFMQPRTCIISAVTLGTAMFFGFAAMAAELPKEGTFSATYSGFGTFKGSQIGKSKYLGMFDENGLTVGKGLMDHLTWHCFGLQDTTDGMTQFKGNCVGTDPDKDQIAMDIASDGRQAWDAKSYAVTGTFTAGSGKYAGITGIYTYVVHSPEFRAATEGTYLNYSPGEGSYKLP